MRSKAFQALMTLSVASAALLLAVGGAAAGGGHGKGKGNQHSAFGANGRTGFHFQVLDQLTGKPDRLLIQGSGTFGAKHANGGGTFDHFQAVGSPPLPLIATGTWKATDVVSWTPGLTHGIYQGGILMIHATFMPRGAAPINGVLIQIDCNLGPAGFSTGKTEGAVVTFPGTPQVVFSPTSPPTGITIFTVGKGKRK